MRVAVRAGLVLSLVLSAGCFCSPARAWMVGRVAAGQTAEEAETQGAEQASGAWLAVMDAGRYAESWKSAAAAVQSAVSQEKWAVMMKGAREPLGKVESRKMLRATHTASLPGAPDGDYVVIQYQTSFEHKRSAMETLTMSREKDNLWRVSGYFIK